MTISIKLRLHRHLNLGGDPGGVFLCAPAPALAVGGSSHSRPARPQFPIAAQPFARNNILGR